MPALLISMSSGSSPSAALSEWTESPSDTSIPSMMRMPSALSSGLPVLQTPMTLSPRSLSWTVSCRPMPRLQPVMRVVVIAGSLCSCFEDSRWDCRFATGQAASLLDPSNTVRKPIPPRQKCKRPQKGPFLILAERVGFEPTIGY